MLMYQAPGDEYFVMKGDPVVSEDSCKVFSCILLR